MPVVKQMHSRVSDKWGSGQYLTSRDGGARKHHGLDIVVKPGELVFSPIPGQVVRETKPYKNDNRYTGVLIKGTGEWTGYEVKMFYVHGLLSGPVKAGDSVGFAQNLAERYQGITNHVHLEVTRNGEPVPPNEVFGMSF